MNVLKSAQLVGRSVINVLFSHLIAKVCYIDSLPIKKFVKRGYSIFIRFV